MDPIMDYVAPGATHSQEWLDKNCPIETRCEVLDGRRQQTMRQLVNAWEWIGQGEGGENPHRHPDGWVPLYGPTGGATPEFVFVVVLGPTTGRWYVVKCDYQQVTAKEFNRLTGRAVPKRMRPNPSGEGRYEEPYTWLEPYECLDTWTMETDTTDGDEAVDQAKHWAGELRLQWELEGDGWGQEVPFSPERMEFLRRVVRDEGEAMLESILDEVDRASTLAEIE